MFGTALAAARTLRRALAGAGEGSALQFAAAQTLLAALIVAAAPLGLGVYAQFSGEELPNFSYPHLNPLSYAESVPIAVSAALLAGNFLVHTRNNALPRSPAAIASGVGITAALFAVLWWVFTWYIVGDGDHHFLRLRGAIIRALQQIRVDEPPVLRHSLRAHRLGRINPSLGYN